MILRILLLVLGFVLIGNSSMAGELVLSPEVEELRLAVDKPAVFSFIKQGVYKTYLSFLIRSEPEKAEGYTKGLVIHINGTRIKTLERLISKPFKCKVEEETNDWCNAHGIWTVPVSGDYSLFVFDITDLIKNKNRIIFLRVPRASSETPFFLKEVKIVYESGNVEPSLEKIEEEIKPRKTEHLKKEVKLTHKEREVRTTALEPVSFSFALPEVKEAHLSFLVRAKSRKPAGYVSALIIEINGTQIKDTKRLINKLTTGESNVTSYGLWKVPKSRDYSSFVFDISDLVEKENKLVFKRVLSSEEAPLYFKQVKIMYE
ncbi:hypothetical protein KKC91_09625 [bacterium]|nr:hypothetical protein [bacterium]